VEKNLSEPEAGPVIAYERHGRWQPVPENCEPWWVSVLWYILTCVGIVAGLLVLGAALLLFFG
jgi:hypothetical protein